MARGYPDYFGQQFYPYYGYPTLFSIGANTAAGETTLLCTLTGKGCVDLIRLVSTDSDWNAGDRVWVSYDSNYRDQFTFEEMLGFGMDRPIQGMGFLAAYDPNTPYLCWLEVGPVSYGQQVKVYYQNIGAAVVAVTLYVFYSTFSLA